MLCIAVRTFRRSGRSTAASRRRLSSNDCMVGRHRLKCPPSSKNSMDIAVGRTHCSGEEDREAAARLKRRRSIWRWRSFRSITAKLPIEGRLDGWRRRARFTVVLGTALLPFSADVAEPLWNAALDPHKRCPNAFQAACALATDAPARSTLESRSTRRSSIIWCRWKPSDLVACRTNCCGRHMIV